MSAPDSTSRFADVAVPVGEETARLLVAEVVVTDEYGTVVASASPQCSGRPRRNREILRVPIEVDTRRGEVVVFGNGRGLPVSEHVARALIDLMVTQATGMTDAPDHHELRDKFILDLLTGVLSDEEGTIREAQILGVDLAPPRAVILIDASEFILGPYPYESAELRSSVARRRAQATISSVATFFKLPTDAICGYIGNGEIAVLKASTTQDLAAWANGEPVDGDAPASWANLSALKRAAAALRVRLRHDLDSDVHVAIGRYHTGVQGLSKSYRDASFALELGKRLHASEGVHCLDTLGVAAFVGVSDERTKSDLARHLLAPIVSEGNLVETLETFFEKNCSPTPTAAQLGIHRNTLGYRLERIAQLVGLDPRNFEHAVQLRAALVLASLLTT